jgi:hypothetical protein
MSHHDDQHGHDHQDEGTEGGAAVSEGGSGALNSETALGGADSVPDTPDINDTGEGDAVDTSEPGGDTR